MKSYKQFINESNTNNESYFELVDILYSKVFDDWNIISATDEDLNALNYTDHKFWLYNINGKLNNVAYISPKLGCDSINSHISLPVFID